MYSNKFYINYNDLIVCKQSVNAITQYFYNQQLKDLIIQWLVDNLMI